METANRCGYFEAEVELLERSLHVVEQRIHSDAFLKENDYVGGALFNFAARFRK
jgi:hypothetical protein